MKRLFCLTGTLSLLVACGSGETAPSANTTPTIPSGTAGSTLDCRGARRTATGACANIDRASTGGTSGEGRPIATGGGASISGGTENGGAASSEPRGRNQPSGTSSGGNPTGGGTARGGAVSASGGVLSASGGAPSKCDPGSRTTTWATSCPASAAPCVSGTWVAGGPDPDHATFTVRAESAHFVVYADESATTDSAARAAVDHLEKVWNLYFQGPMYMREPLCDQSTKYKVSIHVHSDWGFTGSTWTTNRMGMWLNPRGLTDHYVLAHEFMHGVQAVHGGLACPDSNTCGWVWESHANWSAQQQPEFHATDVHCSEMLANMPHLYLGSTRDRYCNWQFMEYLKDKYCFSAVNAIWTGARAPDPLTAIRNERGWSVSQLNDFIGEWAMHNVTWDYQDPPPQSTTGNNLSALFRSKYGSITETSPAIRRLRTTKVEPLDASFRSSRRFASPFYWAPQRYGYNVIRLFPDANVSSVTVTFRGVTSTPASPDFRWGLVATDSAVTTARYSTLQAGSEGTLNFCVNSGESLFLIVTATPSEWYPIVWDQPYNSVPRYPYMFQLAGAWPDGFRNGTPDACPSGLVRASNGGGCAPPGTTAFVGPYATVLGGEVSANARIEDHATIVNGKVGSATVGAMTILDGGFNLSSGTAKTTFYPLGSFDTGQGLSGGTLVGDVEYRGVGTSRASGTCSGFVDGATCIDPGADNTAAPPYTWR